MSAVISQSDPLDGLAQLRVDGGVAVTFAGLDGWTRATLVREADGHRVRFPGDGQTGPREAILLNTGGGLAGGDRVRFDIECGPGASASVTSVSAERVYRAIGRPTQVTVTLVVGTAGALCWMPQEAILYDGARLDRRIHAELAPNASLTLYDCIVFGRRGADERLTTGSLDDRWLIRRDRRLVHAEAVRIAGDIETRLGRGAVGAGAHVTATLLHVATGAADLLEPVRAALAGHPHVYAAASAWSGKLVVRAIGTRADHLQKAMTMAATVLTNRPASLVWQG